MLTIVNASTIFVLFLLKVALLRKVLVYLDLKLLSIVVSKNLIQTHCVVLKFNL